MPNPIEIRRNPDGSIDEIIADGKIHIEQMSNDGWYMGIDLPDGSYWQFWVGSKNRRSPVEFLHTNKSPGPANDSVTTLSHNTRRTER